MAQGERIGFENAGLVKKLYSQIKPYEGATQIGVSTKKDRGPEKKFMKAFEEYRDKKHGGVFKAAAEALGFKRETIKGVFDRVRLAETGTRAGGTGLGKGSKIQTTVPVPKNVTKFTEATTLAKKNKNYFKDKIKKFNNKKFYTNKDIANILGIDVTDKNSLDYLTQTLKKLNVKTNPKTPQQNLFQLGDAVTKLTKGVEKKLVKGDRQATTTRKISDAKLDPELTQFLENFKSKVRSLSKDADVYVPRAVEDVGHPLSIKITSKYPNLVKDSNINKINTLIFQDPTINRTLFEATGYESKHDELLKQLNNLVGKKLNNKDLVKLNEIKTSLNNLHSKVINDVKNLSKTNSYFKGQEQRIPKIDINIPKVGETFKSKNLFVDMSNVNPAFKVGLVDDIAPGAKFFTDLSLKEKELYKQNVLDQTKFNTEKFYVKAGFPKEDVQRLKETLDFGTDLKTGIGEGVTLGSNLGNVSKKLAGKVLGDLSISLGSPVSLLGLNAYLGVDPTESLDRAILGGEVALAPSGIKALTSRLDAIKNPAVRKGIETLAGLRLPGVFTPANVMRAARFAQPLGIAALAGEGLYQLGKLGYEDQQRFNALSPEEQAAERAEQEKFAFDIEGS